VSIVGDVRISRGIEFKMTGAAERKEQEPKLVLDDKGQESAGQRSEGNELVDDNECE